MAKYVIIQALDFPGLGVSAVGSMPGGRIADKMLPNSQPPTLNLMNTLVFLAALALVPQPTKLVEKPGVCTQTAIREVTDPAVPAEGYRLSVRPDGITVTSSTAAGRFYAGVTLDQLRTTVGKGAAYPCVEIEDAPAYPWRGVLLDDCRHFFGKEVVKKTIDLIARHKMNRFHWHLTEDQGWRLDIPGYPELVKYGATRAASVAHKHFTTDKKALDKLVHAPYGPFFYTEADVKEIIAYAAERHVTIVPEIELPGHVYTVLAAHPEFACFPENINPRAPRCVWGIEKDVLCIGNDAAIAYMEGILDWVCRTFPGDVVHIGGDECPQERWKTCPKCQARIKAAGLKDEKDLQPWLTTRIVKFLEQRGKRALGWDEYLLGDVPKSAIGMSWRTGRNGAGHELVSGAKAATLGHDVVMTPISHCYIDYRQGLAHDPFEYIGGRHGRCITLAQAYSFNPREGVPPEAQHHILGGQGNNWSEVTWNGYDLDWKMWPRTCALAEVFWTGDKRPDFENFRDRMIVHRMRLIDQFVNCAPLY